MCYAADGVLLVLSELHAYSRRVLGISNTGSPFTFRFVERLMHDKRMDCGILEQLLTKEDNLS